jgi:hypothetical protein
MIRHSRFRHHLRVDYDSCRDESFDDSLLVVVDSSLQYSDDSSVDSDELDFDHFSVENFDFDHFFDFGSTFLISVRLRVDFCSISVRLRV